MTRPVTTFDFTTREIDRHQAKVAHLTGICPHCGDAGWFIDMEASLLNPDAGFYYCVCSHGVAERAKAAAEDAEAEAEAEREQELRDQQARDEDTPSGQQQYARLWPVSGR